MTEKHYRAPDSVLEGPKNEISYSKYGWRILATVAVFVVANVYLGPRLGEQDAPCASQGTRSVLNDPELVWNNIPPSSADKLFWTSCYDGKQCARLMLPLDYANPDGPQAGVALIKVPSKFPPGDEQYRGPILLNPGGPGGSGVSLVEGRGLQFQQLIGDEFDIVGFDPRGISRTTPPVVVFKDSAEDAAWRIRVQDTPPPNTTVDSVARLWAGAQVFGSIANQTTAHSSPYVSTALVARDMLSITQAHGFDKLQYWGFSYGTVLGSTFAAMFPDNVGRLIIDGVVDAENYYAGLWSNNLLDTDQTLRTILDACVAAGPTLCALHEPTTAAVHARLSAIFAALKTRPLPVRSNGTGKEYALIDYKTARRALFAQLYAPYGGTARAAGYPSMALLHALARLEAGDGLPLARHAGLVPAAPPFVCACPGAPPAPPATPDASIAIGCGDTGRARARDTVADLEAHFAHMGTFTEFADQWLFRVGCTGWQAQPVERFAGAFVADTAHPLLIIGNTADPVTPLAHARTMSRGFNNSVVLHQDSAGHCSLSATSLCTAKAVRAYFREGTLPKNGTVCSVESTIFPSYHETQSVQALQGEDRVVMEAWRELRESFEIPRFGMGF